MEEQVDMKQRQICSAQGTYTCGWVSHLLVSHMNLENKNKLDSQLQSACKPDIIYSKINKRCSSQNECTKGRSSQHKEVCSLQSGITLYSFLDRRNITSLDIQLLR